MPLMFLLDRSVLCAKLCYGCWLPLLLLLLLLLPSYEISRPCACVCVCTPAVAADAPPLAILLPPNPLHAGLASTTFTSDRWMWRVLSCRCWRRLTSSV